MNASRVVNQLHCLWFKYRFGPQPLALCVKLVPNLSIVSNWSSTFQPCVKMVIAVKCWIENADVANGLFLILKMSDVACQLKF
jgi:hypothetical protein